MTSASRETWRNLELVGVSAAGQFRTMETGAEVPAGPILYAIDVDGRYHLLIPVGAHVAVHPDRQSAGVHLERRVLGDAGRHETFIDVSCRKHHLHEVFVHLSAEMVREVEESPNQPEAACRRVLSRWRELLSREALGILSTEALIGLWGELWHMRELASRNPASSANWTGPSGAVHDFCSPSASLEVKTSLAREGRRFEIHGVDQLATPKGAALFFASLHLEPNEAVGESISGIVDDLIALGCDTVDLLRKLAAVGFDSRDAAHYNRLRYRVRESRIYLVDEQFPKILRSSFKTGALPERVERLRYIVDLNGEPPTPLDAEALNSLYTALAEVEG